MDIVYRGVVTVVFLVTLPVQLVIAGILLLASGTPVLFAQRRIGKGGKPFTMYKFRTMIPGAELSKERYVHLNESQEPAFKIYHDPRFTGIGKFLSHTGLDELPQLWNIWNGEMAFIGPRPLPVSEAKKLAPWMRERHAVLPGIISPAVLSGEYHKNISAWMKSDISYARTKSIRTDVRLLFRFLPFLGDLLLREVRRKQH